MVWNSRTRRSTAGPIRLIRPAGTAFTGNGKAEQPALPSAEIRRLADAAPATGGTGQIAEPRRFKPFAGAASWGLARAEPGSGNASPGVRSRNPGVPRDTRTIARVSQQEMIRGQGAGGIGPPGVAGQRESLAAAAAPIGLARARRSGTARASSRCRGNARRPRSGSRSPRGSPRDGREVEAGQGSGGMAGQHPARPG